MSVIPTRGNNSNCIQNYALTSANLVDVVDNNCGLNSGLTTNNLALVHHQQIVDPSQNNIIIQQGQTVNMETGFMGQVNPAYGLTEVDLKCV